MSLTSSFLFTYELWSPLVSFESAVEIGCGNGKLCEFLVSKGCSVVGIDIIEGIYDRRLYKYLRKDISKDVLPFNKGEYDLGCAFDALEH